MSRQQMFRPGEPRYMTRGIAERLPFLYQILLWDTIDKLRDSGYELDWLQVFELNTENSPDRRKETFLVISHSQEQPPYKKQYRIPVSRDEKHVNGKIYVIDDLEYATMLWADEY